MKNKTFHEMQLKKQLRDKKNNGVKVVIWNLTPKSRQLIESFGYYVEPYIYQINTKTFSNILLIKNPLLRDLHYLNKKGKNSVCRTLRKEEKKILDGSGIRYKPIKYKIYLRSK